MKNCVLRFVLIGAATGLMISPLGGCAKKVVSIEAIEQSAKIEDTVGARTSAADKPLSSEASLAERADTLAAVGTNDGAGPSESLDTPPPSREELYGKGNLADFVEGSRTSQGALPVYFEFNRFTIPPDQVERIRANAQYLKKNPAIKARIEGNCDDRGTYEYNLALGEYRAVSAKKYLINLGVSEERLTTLSYGEERLLNTGEGEEAWAENRRDDFVITR